MNHYVSAILQDCKIAGANDKNILNNLDLFYFIQDTLGSRCQKCLSGVLYFMQIYFISIKSSLQEVTHF